ncbi:MAG: AsmA-like C-terminal region-containing protein [Rhodosalinus sp.]
MTEAEGSPHPPRTCLARRLVVAALAGLASFAVAATAIALSDLSVTAPRWLEKRVAARLAVAMPGLGVSFESIELSLERDGRPMLSLAGVTLTDAGGTPQASLAQMRGVLAPAPLLWGKAELNELHLSGAILQVRRDRQGRFDFALGGAGTGFDSPGAAVAAIDRWAEHAAFAGLDRVEAHGLTLRYEDARARRGWTADGGRLRLTRSDGRLRVAADFALLSGRDAAATLELNAESTIGAQAVSFGAKFEGMEAADIATQSPALAWLGVLNAPISGALRSAVAEDGTLGPLHATLQIGEGVLRPEMAARPIPFRAARSYFTYDPATAILRFDEIALDSELISLTAQAEAVLHGLETGWPTRLTSQLTLGEVTAKPGRLYADALTLEGAEADLSVRLDPFAVRLGRLRIDDPALPLRLSGRADVGAEGWRIALDAQTEGVTPDMVMTWWPEGWAPQARRWIAENLLAGQVTRAQAAVRAAPGAEPIVSFTAGFEAARIRFLPQMPPIEGAAGQISLHDARFAATAHAGQVTSGTDGRIDIAGTSFVIPDARIPKAPAEVRLVADGALADALWLIDQPPLRLLARAGRTPDIASGRLSVEGWIGLSLRKTLRPKDLALDLSGVLHGVASETIVPGRRLTAARLDARLDDTALTVEGAAALDGLPVAGRWTQPLAPGESGRVSAELRLDRTLLDSFGVSLPPGAVSGAAPATLDLLLPKDAPPAFTLTSALDGLGLSIDALGWRLAPGARGDLRVTGSLGRPARIDRIALEAPGLSASGTIDLARGGGLAAARFDRVRAGGWLDAPVTLRPRGPGRPPAVEIAGGTVDLRALPERSGGGSGAGPPAPVALRLERLTVSDGIALTGFTGRLTAGAGLDGQFTARVNGSAPIQGTLVPVRGRTAVRIRSDNAGRALRASGVFRNAAGGAMDLTLLPTGAPGTFDGQLRITDTRMRNTPALAALLDAISIVGIIDQLQGPGIAFSAVEASFRLTPGQVILTRSSAVGPSMGVSMDGYHDLATGRMDMQGVLSPIYMLNVVGAVLTRKGEGLFGVNFRLRGTGEDPQVSVNPLSALTPGMFREIFRRPPPQVSQ